MPLLNFLKNLGMPVSTILATMGTFGLIGIMEVKDGKTAPEIYLEPYIAKETYKRIKADTAINEKIDIMYIIGEQKKLLEAKTKEGDRISEECKNISIPQGNIKIEQWKREMQQYKDDLDSFRNLFEKKEMRVGESLAIKI